MRVNSQLKGFVSFLTLSVLMIFVSNYFASTDGMLRGAAFANQKHSKRVSKQRQPVPPEWNWFSAADLNAISKNVNQKTDSISNEPCVNTKPNGKANPSFELAYAKMLKIKSQRSERDKEILANIKASEKSSSMVQLNRKIQEIRRKVEVQETKQVAPKYTQKKYQHKPIQKKKKQEVVAVSQDTKEEIIEKANAIMSTISTVAIPNVSPAKTTKLSVIAPPREEPRFVEPVPALDLEDFANDEAMNFVVPQMDLNEIVAIDDMLAIDTAPPVIESLVISAPKKRTKKNRSYQKTDSGRKVETKQGYNRYAPAKPQTIETLYRGANSVYSPRINELVNERKEKIFGTN